MSTGAPRTRGWPRVVLVLAGALGLYLAVALSATALTGDPFAGSAAAAVASLAGALAYRRLSTGRLEPAEPLPAARSRGFWAGVAGALALCWLTGQTLGAWVYQTWGSPALDASVEARSDSPAWLVVAYVLVLAPLGEEAMLRGTAYPALRRMWPPWAAAFVTAMVFAVLHANPVQIALTVPLGLLLAFVYEATRRLWPAVVAHMAFNLASSAVPRDVVERLAEPSMMAVLVLSCALALVALGRRVRAAGGQAPPRGSW